ncbi:Insulin-like growth factor-binding protein-related protein 1 [Lamellibrachia satsuma]|nr:Insulin-like growth factor-binding protein-related protein 1 [Lamellibrachia satsuma]
MASKVELAVILLCGLTVVLAQTWRRRKSDVPADCTTCDRKACVRASGCVAGVMKDRCGCCDVCAKAEFELCDHPRVYQSGEVFGECGDKLECRVRDDLEAGDPAEAMCYCTVEGELCGSDGVDYDNLCRLMAAAVVKRQKITISNKGPCKSAPVIVTPPENIRNLTGTNIAMSCEARGFPIPTIEWMWTRVDGKTVFLPNDDLHLSVNMRGGPEKWQVTGWLQVLEMKKTHEGNITCIAENHLGVAKAVAQLKVVTEQDIKENRYGRY